MKKILQQIKIFNNEQGIALVVVLMVIVVISVLGLAIMGLTANNMKMSTGERNNQSTFYIAESGITLMEGQIRQISSTTCNDAKNTTNFVNAIFDQSNTYEDADFSKAYGLQPKATVTGKVMSKDTTNGLVNIQIQSKGTIGNSNRTLTKSVQIKCTPGKSNSPLTFLNDMAVFTNNAISFSSTINGNIGTNCNTGNCINASPINVGWGGKLNPTSLQEGSISAPNPGATLYKKPDTMSDFNPEVKNIVYRPFSGPDSPYIPPVFPDYPTNLPARTDIVLPSGSQTITADGYYKNITLQGSSTLTIDVGSQNRKIVVDKLLMEQGFINIIGNKSPTGKLIGSLTLYVGNDFVFGTVKKPGSGSSSINQNGDSSKLNIYYRGSGKLILGGTNVINGHVYVQNANIELGGSGSIVGDIIAANATQIDISGGSNLVNRFILAPKATVNMNNGTLNGSVICNNFNLTGGATLNHGIIDDTGGIPFYPPSDSSTATISVNQLMAVREVGN